MTDDPYHHPPELDELRARPMWDLPDEYLGDAGDLVAADPYGYRWAVTSQTLMNRVANDLLTLVGLPPLDLHLPAHYIGTRAAMCSCGHVAYWPERHHDHLEDL